jgi:4-hydroxybenzoate polyprenyltransferase
MLLKALRPKEWVKNLFVFAPLIFTAKFLERSSDLRTVAASLLFCLAASVVYLVNDLADAEADRLNPLKSNRPLAAGRLSWGVVGVAIVVMELLVLAGYWLSPRTTGVILIYQIVNLVYTFGLKRVPVIDLFCVASGFVLRVLAGATVLNVPLSFWMLNTTLCLALYLATVKRRQELLAVGSKARSVLKLYSTDLLDYYAFFSGVMAVVFYGMFVLTVRPALEATLPLVVFGFFRYRYLVVQNLKGESPTDLILTDWALALTVIGWGVLSAVAMTK